MDANRSRRRPTYEGRLLPRPDEEIVDQGLLFDLATVVDRRRMFAFAGAGAATLFVAACGGSGSTSSDPSSSTTTAGAASSTTISGTAQLTEIPDETAGPYPGDGSNGADVLEQSGVVRSDIRSSFGGADAVAEGVAMTLGLTILDMVNSNEPMQGAAVYVWHCDREGRYSMYSEGVTAENYLRGVQITDAAGKVTFTSIVPGCYSGRWPHIHFEVYPDEASITDSTNAIATSQVALPQAMCEAVYVENGYEASVRNLAQVSLESDNVFGDDGGKLQLATVSGGVADGYHVTLTAAVDASTAPTGGGMSPGGGPGGAGGRGGPPTR